MATTAGTILGSTAIGAIVPGATGAGMILGTIATTAGTIPGTMATTAIPGIMVGDLMIPGTTAIMATAGAATRVERTMEQA